MTEANKKDYVKLYVAYRWCRGIEQQFLALQKGFNEIIPQHLMKPFNERELELIIGRVQQDKSRDTERHNIFSSPKGGLGKVDIVDWRQNTRLKHCNADTPVVKWFWEILEEYTEDRRAKLLQFVTGSSRVPLQARKRIKYVSFLNFSR